MHTPHSLREHNLVLCLFGLAVTFAWLLLKGIKPYLHNRCRYLSVGKSISCQSCRPLILHPDMGLLSLFTPLSIRLALPAVTQFSEW